MNENVFKLEKHFDFHYQQLFGRSKYCGSSRYALRRTSAFPVSSKLYSICIQGTVGEWCWSENEFDWIGSKGESQRNFFNRKTWWKEMISTSWRLRKIRQTWPEANKLNFRNQIRCYTADERSPKISDSTAPRKVQRKSPKTPFRMLIWS